MANPEFANEDLFTGKGESEQQHILIQAARQLFQERGYGKVKLSDIARGAGLTLKETQLYFTSPQEICTEVIKSHRQSQHALFEDINQNTNPRQRLSLYLDSLIENTDILITRGCPITNLYFDVKREDHNLASEAAELLKQRLEWIRAQFVEIMRVENNTDLPERLTGAIHGIAILAQVTGNPDLIRNQVNQLKSWIRSM